MTAGKVTDVAVAIFEKPDGTFLLSSRPEGKPYPGYWEFPGGKVEPGERVEDALVRELTEELNVTITRAAPWFTFIMHYTHATVRLHCWRVLDWHGEMRGMEGQVFAWQRLEAISVSPTLPGCVPIFKALALPRVMAVSNAAERGVDAWLGDLDGMLAAGLKLVQVREKSFPRERLEALARETIARARPHGARVILNGDARLARHVGADGVHLPEAMLGGLAARPEFPLASASVHGRAAIERAAALGLDFVVLGAVKATASHPGTAPLGWAGFGALARAAPLPVFAIGGLAPGDHAAAIEVGAHGIAMQRARWR